MNQFNVAIPDTSAEEFADNILPVRSQHTPDSEEMDRDGPVRGFAVLQAFPQFFAVMGLSITQYLHDPSLNRSPTVTVSVS